MAFNPGRPRLVRISSRCSTTDKGTKPSTPEQHAKLVSAFSPDTPPETPDNIDDNERVRNVAATSSLIQTTLGLPIMDAPRPITPPRSPSVSSGGTQSQRLNHSELIAKPDTVVHKPRRSPSSRIKQLIWILTQLEDSVANFPLTMLQPNSPVILELRRQRNPRFASASTAQASPSASHPLSSHFLPRRSRSSSLRFSPSRSREDESQQIADVNDSHLQPLRNIFPSTTDAFRCSLFATVLALNHISELLSSSFPPTSRQYSLKIPDKAKARLGIRLPLLASGSLERSQLRSRIVKLLEGLQMCARRLIETICGHGLGKMDEALLDAVGEVVKMVY